MGTVLPRLKKKKRKHSNKSALSHFPNDFDHKNVGIYGVFMF